MSDKQSLGAVKAWPKTVSIRGYATRSDDGEIWVKDREGTWIVQEEDIVSRSKWEGVGDFEGDPVVINVRDGAEILEVRPTTVCIAPRPLTLAQVARGPIGKGHEELDMLADRFARHLGFSPFEGSQGYGGYITVCCYETGEWGHDCDGDDCG